ncbi:hypothetical protein [uncultured Corynebacterium sp.]|uniref:hypothetical protein n=1 Tax=uncultured Corynebacterium sp. TaxID=159447 RepID=UPI0025F6C2E6|nr:hypothetical protein [uncultured Corynebacterium sp.]
MGDSIAQVAEVLERLHLFLRHHLLVVDTVHNPPEGIRILRVHGLAKELFDVVEDREKRAEVSWLMVAQSKNYFDMLLPGNDGAGRRGNTCGCWA